MRKLGEKIGDVLAVGVSVIGIFYMGIIFLYKMAYVGTDASFFEMVETVFNMFLQ